MRHGRPMAGFKRGSPTGTESPREKDSHKQPPQEVSPTFEEL